MCRIFGRTTIPPYEEQDGDLFPHEAWLELGIARMAMFQTGIGYDLDLPVVHANGTQLWVNMRANVLRNSEGELIGVQGMVQDITERKNSETVMAQSEMRYRTLVENSPEAIVVQREGRILFANKACAKMFGAKSASDIVGTSVLDFVHPDFHQRTIARMQSISKLGELAPLVGLTLIKLDRTLIEGEAQSTAVLFDGASAIQIYLRDITESKRQASELSALRTDMQSMMEWQVARHTIAALAHEINQPLASVSVLCEAASRMLAMDGLPNDSAAERPKRLEQTLQRMASESERAGTVIRQLMNSVRQPDVTLEPTLLNVLLDEASKIVRHDIAFDGRIHISCPGNLTPININQLQITKVLVNLLNNSVQAMQSVQMSEGDIWISAALEPDGSAVRVSVRDSGPGIDAKTEREMFQAFATTKPNGLGMGLVISRALVEAHGGKLWLEADTIDGAIFHFTLPTSH
jgi:PAS domain S-box-containing protein